MNDDICAHDPTDRYELVSWPVATQFCSHADCARWRIAVVHRTGDGTCADFYGAGLEDYRTCITVAKEWVPEWTGAAFMYDLGGHAHEIEA